MVVYTGIALESVFINCVQCNAEFEFTSEEQERYYKMGFDNPRRCSQCRKNKLDITDTDETQKNKNKKKYYRSKYQ